jgi:hypothetical protein
MFHPKDGPDIRCAGEMRNFISFGKSERKRTLERRRRRWEHNINRGLKEIGWEGVDWIHFGDATRPFGSIKDGEILDKLGRRSQELSYMQITS